jgi:hypothetical protein
MLLYHLDEHGSCSSKNSAPEQMPGDEDIGVRTLGADRVSQLYAAANPLSWCRNTAPLQFRV